MSTTVARARQREPPHGRCPPPRPRRLAPLKYLTVFTFSSRVASSSHTNTVRGCCWKADTVHMWLTPSSMALYRAKALWAPVMRIITCGPEDQPAVGEEPRSPAAGPQPSARRPHARTVARTPAVPRPPALDTRSPRARAPGGRRCAPRPRVRALVPHVTGPPGTFDGDRESASWADVPHRGPRLIPAVPTPRWVNF